MTQIFGYSIPIPSWLGLSIFIGGWVALSFWISQLFNRYIWRWAEKTKIRFGQILVAGLLAEPPPFVRFIPGFADSALIFTLICQGREFVDQYLVQHELRHRIFERFRREGIEIPFPQRTGHLGQEEN